MMVNMGDRGLVGGRDGSPPTLGLERWREANPSVYSSTPHAMTPLRIKGRPC
jgi:hypothetical protein